MSANAIKESMTIEDVKEVLVSIGASDFLDNEEGFRTNTICHNSNGGGFNLAYSHETKSFFCFSECNCHYDIFSLIQKNAEINGEELNFFEAQRMLSKNTRRGFGYEVNSQDRENSGLSWIERFSNVQDLEEPELEEYSDYVLQLYSGHNNHPAFIDDNISSEVMDKYCIRFDPVENALIIPHRHHKTGKIIGLMQRNFDDWKVKNGFKYIPSRVQNIKFNFPKHANLYGLYENREAIERHGRVIVFESEKSVMQFESYFGFSIAVALGGSSLSPLQVKLLTELDIEEVVLAFDKDFNTLESLEADLVRNFIVDTASKLNSYVNVSAMFDTENLLGYKDSPSDKGKEILTHLYQNRQEVYSKQ